jgi:DNA-binding GntR family transcriptional regulator
MKASRTTAPAEDAVPGHTPGATRGALVTAALELDILDGKLRPGARLDEESIGKRFGVSRTPVREAFKHLASAGLIEIKPHSGAFVATLTISVLVEMFEMMAILEAACAALAARRHDVTDRAALHAAQEACRLAAEEEDPEKFYAANAQLHEAIYRASHNNYVENQTVTLRQRLEPYRRSITFHRGLMHKSMTEHQRVIDAILQMDEEAAHRMMSKHFDTLLSDVVTMIEAINRPAPAVAPTPAAAAPQRRAAAAPAKPKRAPVRRAVKKAA